MKPSRRTQPYRKGARGPSLPLTNMLRGQPAFLNNPMDVRRRTAKKRKTSLAAELARLRAR